ncbi:WD40-repeat-containing domain protein [Catenaria anguillulae PL171]|uniref:WD40-repeat-containing domain protein n=1 Tax=Catenaria anguillulae PL171 TaxID=765915 RepID=A0A1Y2HFJ6_9FUNG|nr:WD40-repeat-containing domain protein [Catenaria anguillulae PL171]
MKPTPTSAANSGALYEYSADKAYLAVLQRIADAQRITLWKTANASVIVDHQPPERSTVSSIAWGNIFSNKGEATPVLAACLSTGEIQLVSALTGTVHSTLSGTHSSAVNAVVFVPGKNVAYSCGQDDWIVMWNLVSGSCEGKFKTKNSVSPKRLLVTPSGSRLIVADSGVSIFEIPSNKHVTKFPAHASDILSLAVTADERLLLTAADRDRFVNVFDMGSGQPLPALSLDHNAASVAVSSSAGHVAVLTETGALALWSSPASAGPTGKKANKRAKFSARMAEAVLDVKSKETGEKVAITSVAFVAEGQGRLVMTRGNSMNPVFETLTYIKDDELVSTETLVRTTQTAHTVNPATGKRQAYRQTGTTASLHAADAAIGAPRLDQPSAEDLQKPLAERLAALQVTASGPSASQSGTAGVIDVTSLHITLTQALHSNDTDLLESVLNAPFLTSAAIATTVRKVPTQHIVPLMHAVIDRFMRTHSRAGHLLEWIKAVVTMHTGYLMTVPDLVRKLAAFHHALETRIDQGKQLLKLQGRLDLVLAQVEMHHPAQAAAAAQAANVGAVGAQGGVVIVDEDADGDEDVGYFEDLAFMSSKKASTLRHVQRRATSRTLEALGEELNSADVAGAGSDDDQDMDVDGEMDSDDGMDVDEAADSDEESGSDESGDEQQLNGLSSDEDNDSGDESN